MIDDNGLHTPIIPPNVVLGLLDLADRRGLHVDPWFAGSGLSRADLTVPEARLSYRQAAAIVHRALAALPAGPVGLQLGTTDLLRSFGILGFAVRACDTIGDAIAVGVQFHQASGSLADFEFHADSDQFAIELTERHPDRTLLPFIAEEAFGSILVLARAIIGNEFTPTGLELAYPPPPYLPAYTRLFRCPIEFEATGNRLHGPTALLTRPIATSSAAHLAVALDATRRMVDPSDRRPGIVAAVEGVLRRNLRQPLTMAEVARQLHITERTLHRQLAAAGHQFSAIRDRVRHQRAKILLRESNQPIAAIAREVGYSDGREFRRAYHRWTGHPPSTERP
ncbi:AraC-like DNA-binding protein [Nocardia transvalensis]|uniref:AraC-like DNA-binding protein n=1 Tax=Nocardia transvalensis TaxID=37333 RepID=A0A7W9PIP7_9NOCA|nr:AraC family transcriptional regulator [Nocardia transvalensis]MBB5916797.1 AraC-like DNA-binding protein [Nocardia transvalensis]